MKGHRTLLFHRAAKITSQSQNAVNWQAQSSLIMNFKKAAPYIGLIFLAILSFGLKKCQESRNTKQVQDNSQTSQKRKDPKPSVKAEPRGLNRHPSKINYSKHARCRMDCRQISEHEIQEILVNGVINYKKSSLQAGECQKKYAVEGLTADQQRVRVIFAPCADELTVVTCIDLGKDWTCDCQ